MPAVINIAIGIFLLDYSRSQAFNVFIIASFVGTMMYLTLHITYNILPRIYKKRKGGMYVPVCVCNCVYLFVISYAKILYGNYWLWDECK